MSIKEDLEMQLGEFNFYRNMIRMGQAGKRNTIIEKKDGTNAIIHHVTKEFPIPGLNAKIGDIERITIFIDDKEYEFVACQ